MSRALQWLLPEQQVQTLVWNAAASLTVDVVDSVPVAGINVDHEAPVVEVSSGWKLTCPRRREVARSAYAWLVLSSHAVLALLGPLRLKPYLRGTNVSAPVDGKRGDLHLCRHDWLQRVHVRCGVVLQVHVLAGAVGKV